MTEDGPWIGLAEGDTFEEMIQAALDQSKELLGHELARLKTLQKTNPNIRQDEIATAETLLNEAQQEIAKASIRLDAVRLILAAA